MLRLIIKDITFNLKYIFLGFLTVIVLSLYLIKYNSDPMNLFILLLVVPLYLFIFFVGFGCYNDEKSDAFKFLKALPIKRNHIVSSKYIQSLATLILSFIMLVGIIDYFELKSLLNFEILIFMFSNFLIFMSLFLYIFFRFNFFLSQFAGFLLIPLFALVTKFQNYFNMLFYKLVFQNYTLFIVSGIMCAITYVLSVKTIRTREWMSSCKILILKYCREEIKYLLTKRRMLRYGNN